MYFNEASGQVFIGISQKNKYLLEPLIHIYGGRVDISSPKVEAFKYVIYRKAELFNLIDNYFNKYPLISSKYLDYLDWLHVFNLQETHSLTTLYLEEAIKIRKNFNSTRTTYTWDHLNNCYLSKP